MTLKDALKGALPPSLLSPSTQRVYNLGGSGAALLLSTSKDPLLMVESNDLAGREQRVRPFDAIARPRPGGRPGDRRDRDRDHEASKNMSRGMAIGHHAPPLLGEQAHRF